MGFFSPSGSRPTWDESPGLNAPRLPPSHQVDDYGWNNVGFHAKAQPNSNEVSTPHIDSLAATGIILDRFYAYRFCSPSRSSFLTGRNCIHVNTGNDPLTLWNPADPVSGYAGIPKNMTAIASKLAGVGYNTIQSGKWHVRRGRRRGRRGRRRGRRHGRRRTRRRRA